MTVLNSDSLMGYGSKTGTVPAWGLSQAFAVRTSAVPWLVNSRDSPRWSWGQSRVHYKVA